MVASNRGDVVAKLRELQQQFYRHLPDKLVQIDDAWQRVVSHDDGDLEEFHRLIHSLAGSAGTFGAMTVSAAARELESFLKHVKVIPASELDHASTQMIADLLIQLKETAASWQPTGVPYLAPGSEHRTPRPDNALVYLLEDDETQSEEIKKRLEEGCFKVECFQSLHDFETACAARIPAALIMDMVLAEGATAGADAITWIKQRISDCPPVIVISVRTDIDARLAAARAGANRYFSKPLNMAALIQTLNGLTARVAARPYHILIIDDDETLSEYYATILREAGMEVRTLGDPLAALDVIPKFQPDLVLMDIYMPGCTGPELAQVIRQDDLWAQMPIMFLSTEGDLDRQLTAMNLGGDDFLTKPVAPGHLVAAVTARAKRARWITRLNRDLEKSLREVEYSYITLDRHAIVSIADAAGRITYVNDRFCDISGYSREELLGQNHRIVKSKRHTAAFYSEMWQAIRQGKVWNGVICNLRKDGREYWVDSTIVPFLDERGVPYQYVSARTDITALRINEERLQRSQSFANIGTWDWNIQTGELYWSERIAPLFGYHDPKTETTYENFLNAVHPDDRQSVVDAVNACVEGGARYEIEHRVIWPSGETRWLLERGDVERSEAGEPLHMLGVVQDITQRKQIEEALQESEEQFRATAEAAQDAIIVIDDQERVTFWNRAAESIFGYAALEVIGKKLHRLVLPEAMLDAQQQRYRHYQLTGEGSALGTTRELIAQDRNGRQFPVEVSLSQVNIDGHRHAVGIARDISARKQAQAALVEAKEEAESANRAKSQFLSSMSHELRTPMNAIIGFAQLMEMDADSLDETQRDNVSEILRAGRHLLDLINDVLDLAKIEAGYIDLAIEAVALADVLAECSSLMAPLAQARGIAMTALWNGEQVQSGQLPLEMAVRADRTRLKQVLLNLLSNAVKYNREMGRIVIRCEPVAGGKIRVSVSDSGPGIDPKWQEHLFEAFNRLEAAQSTIEGSGIGLVISRNIVELMGGTIGFSSQVGEGSTFWIELPQDLSLARQPAVTQQEQTAAPGVRPAEHTVLYIEDNPANLRLVSQLFAQRPRIRLLSAHNGELGLALARQYRPDLILADINLPGMSGVELIKQLRQSAELAGTPVIAISANAMHADIAAAIAAGFDHYITKPIDIRALLRAVDAVLERA